MLKFNLNVKNYMHNIQKTRKQLVNFDEKENFAKENIKILLKYLHYRLKYKTSTGTQNPNDRSECVCQNN